MHQWVGIATGLYMLLIGISGAVAVFRQDLQRAAYPEFFTPARAALPLASPTRVLENLRRRYPEGRLSGIDWPTSRRDTFLAYVTVGSEFRTVFAHPVTGRVAGELPYDWIRRLQDLHFDLLGGATGRRINGVGATCLLVMCVTGLIVWWPGRSRWRDGLRVDTRRGWKRVNRELHGAIGFWATALLLIWAVTGVYFAFPQAFRSILGGVSALTVVRAPESTLPASPTPPGPLAPDVFIASAQRRVPEARVARIVLPSTATGAFLVVMARETHGDWDSSDELSLWFDQYTGALLRIRDHRQRTAGDAMTAWIGPLHVGSFGGLPVRIVWATGGLILPLLFVTGAVMSWNRRGRSILRDPSSTFPSSLSDAGIGTRNSDPEP
jgi:uncharacterized iron-regulated membrane protein